MSALDTQAAPAAISLDPSRGGGVLAVVGGALDDSTIDLALALAEHARCSIHVLHLVEVPAVLPLLAYARTLEAHDPDGVLDRAVQRGGAAVATAEMLLCRGLGPAVADEVVARGCEDLVIGAPSGGWWARWRRTLALAHIRAHVPCRISVVHASHAAVPARMSAAVQ